MKSRKFSIIAIVFACVLGISMIGMGVAAASGYLSWSGSATYTVNDKGGDVTVDTYTTSTGSWSGNTWNLGTVDAGGSYTATVTVHNTHAHSVVVTPTTSSGTDYTASWTGATTIVAGGNTVLTLTVVIHSDAPEGSSGTVNIYIN